MADLMTRVADLRRPPLLVRAARAGLAEYNRTRDLRRVMRTAETPDPDHALPAILAEEGRVEEARRAGDACYSFARHIDLLIAMMAEARLLPGHGAA